MFYREARRDLLTGKVGGFLKTGQTYFGKWNDWHGEYRFRSVR
jgi:hypothetical protein